MPEGAAAKPIAQLSIVTSTESGATGEVTIVRCTGKLVAGAKEILQTEVRGLLPGSKKIVLDLTDVSYMDSTGLGSIIGLYLSAKSAGGRLEVINLSPRVRHLFSITNVLSLFELCGEQNIRIS